MPRRAQDPDRTLVDRLLAAVRKTFTGEDARDPAEDWDVVTGSPARPAREPRGGRRGPRRPSRRPGAAAPGGAGHGRGTPGPRARGASEPDDGAAPAGGRRDGTPRAGTGRGGGRADRRPAPAPEPSLDGAGVAALASGPWLARLGFVLAFVLVGSFAIVLLVGALAPRIAADVGSTVQASVNLPEDTDLPDLRERTLVFAGDGTLLSVLHDEEDRRIVPLSGLPDHVWQAVLTAEDRQFFEHEGYDIEGIGRAAIANLREGAITQGGSTLTQQLAKINFLDDSQTFDRKLSELLYAMALESEFTKEELLDRYLNQVFFGSGAYGVQAAAEEYFGIGAADLSPEQSAMLAGIIRAPSTQNPRVDPETALARRNQVLRGMADQGYLDARIVDELVETELEIIEEGRAVEVKEPYVVEAAKQQFLNDPTFGDTFEERRDRLFGGGLEIHTTIDPTLQDHARDVVRERFTNPDGPTAGIAAVDPTTGAVRAVFSGVDFDEEQFDLARQGRRSPGSSFKTFVMLEALEQGFPRSLSLASPSPISIDYGAAEPWTPRNYGNAGFGTINLDTATRSSVNTYYAQLMMMAGVRNVVELTEELGIDREAAYRGQEFPSISLGGLEGGVSPLEMASAYGAIGNSGTYVEAHFIDRVTEDGEVVYEATPEQRDVLHPAVAAESIDILTGVVTGGTGTPARVQGWQIAGKTGTTDDNRDAWFVGLAPVLSTAVWVGHVEQQTAMPGATGGGTAAPVWRDFMQRALAEFEHAEFPDAGDFEIERERAPVPDVVGLRQAEASRVLSEARFGVSVSAVPSFAPEGVVAWQRPSGGTEQPVGSTVVIGVSTGEPPESTPDEPPEDEGNDDDNDDDNDNGNDNGGGEPTPEPPPPDEEPAPEPTPPPGEGDNGSGDGSGNGNGNGGDTAGRAFHDGLRGVPAGGDVRRRAVRRG